MVLIATAGGAIYEVQAQESEASTTSCPTARNDDSNLVAKFSVAATNQAGVLGPELDQGKRYNVVVSGTFVYNKAGARSDGFDLRINGIRVATARAPGNVYCLPIKGQGAPVHLIIGDVSHADNSGALSVAIYRGK